MCGVAVNMSHQTSETAYKDPDTCPKHGYNLQWRTCLRCDTIKLYNQNSIASLIDLGGKFSREFNQQYSEATEPAMKNFPAEDPYDSDSFDRPRNYSERCALTPATAWVLQKRNHQSPVKDAIVCTKTQRTSLEPRKGLLGMT
ncbi:hypothetical protein BPOR_0427g00120 [Botrytis porri]|uniref:Uncharacterized protein n=1 Tax=Botrytis porri TaxID=87229 RepID=A0A4Z1KLK0_9HELO|nr:hypothetical protein BPOR_0427g00120 [Botrytis porri]